MYCSKLVVQSVFVFSLIFITVCADWEDFLLQCKQLLTKKKNTTYSCKRMKLLDLRSDYTLLVYFHLTCTQGFKMLNLSVQYRDYG